MKLSINPPLSDLPGDNLRRRVGYDRQLLVPAPDRGGRNDHVPSSLRLPGYIASCQTD